MGPEKKHDLEIPPAPPTFRDPFVSARQGRSLLGPRRLTNPNGVVPSMNFREVGLPVRIEDDKQSPGKQTSTHKTS